MNSRNLPTLSNPKTNSPSKQMAELYLSGKFEDCLALIGTFSSNFTKQNQIKILKAGCYANLSINHDEGLRLSNEVIAEEPWNSFAYYGLALCFYANGDFDKCIPPFSRAVELNKPAMRRAVVYKENALKILELLRNGRLLLRSISFVINNCFNFLFKAVADYNAGSFSAAFEKLSLSAGVDPHNKAIKKIVKETSDTFLKAIIHFLENEVLTNAENETKMNHVEFLIKSNKIESALKLIPVDETSARYYYLKGFINYKLGGLKVSMMDFSKALEIDKTMVKAEDLLNKATMFVELIDGASELASLHDYTSACHNLTNALEIDIENKRIVQAIYFQRAMCKFNMCKKEEAFVDYLKFEALQNETGMILNGIKF